MKVRGMRMWEREQFSVALSFSQPVTSRGS